MEREEKDLLIDPGYELQRKREREKEREDDKWDDETYIYFVYVYNTNSTCTRGRHCDCNESKECLMYLMYFLCLFLGSFCFAFANHIRFET